MYRNQELIRFQHCDPAGIVFYPRYVEMINATIEDWFAEAIGFDFAKIHIEMQSAIPVVSLQVDFRGPSRLGDLLQLNLDVERLGTSSIHLSISASVSEDVKFDARISLVHISKEDYRPRPWPDAMRHAISLQS
ncbi:thioesterase family protein [Shinella sp.]|uniref:acyl-CoA thioesterase n=1 Tax=Shinella sp. TaxID=1870904 RepID=UPI002898D3E7|nr:thioesterase family protein [Shinella sp.]